MTHSPVTESDHTIAIIDDLCDTVRNGASIDDLVEILKQAETFERAHGHGHMTEPSRLRICVNHEHLDIDLNMPGSDGFNVFHAACSSASIEIIEYLLIQRKLDPNIEGKDQWRPLEILVKLGFTEGVQLLIRHG